MRLLTVLYKIVVRGLGYLIKHQRVQRIAAAFLFFLVFTFLLSMDFFYGKVDLEVGDVANRNIIAPCSVEYIDEIKTSELRRQAAEEVDGVYTVNNEIILDTKTKINTLIDDIVQVQLDEIWAWKKK